MVFWWNYTKYKFLDGKVKLINRFAHHNYGGLQTIKNRHLQMSTSEAIINL